MSSGSVIRQQYYHSRLPLDLHSNFDAERQFFWSEIIHTLTTKDIVNQAGIAGSNIKLLIVKFKNVYGLKREEQQAVITLLIEMIFKRKNVRTDSKVLLMNFLNEMLASKVELKDLKLDWNAYYEFYLQEFHNNDEKPYRNEQQNISLFTEFIDLVKRSKRYFDSSSIPKVYEIFKENFQPSRADHAMNFLTLFLKIDSDSTSEVYAPLLEDLIQYLSFLYCSKNTLILYNIMKILRQFKNLQWEKHYDQIFTVIFRNLNNLLILDTVAAEDNILCTLLPEEPIGIKAIFKQIPDFLVHLLLPSTHPKYEIVWQYIERIFLLIDRVFNPNAKSEVCDSILKLFKSVVRKFIIRYDRDQFNIHNLAEDPATAEEDGADIFDLDFNDSEYNIPEYLQKHKQNKGKNMAFEKQYALDEVCKERFLQLMDSFLKKLIYMEDPSRSSCKLIQWLCYFEPSRYAIPSIEHIIQAFSYIDDMALTTVKSLALFIMPILCDRKLCPSGLKYALQFLKVSFKLFEVQGLKENIDLIETYSKFFTCVPINRYKDLLETFKSENPNKGEKELSELLTDDIGGSEFDSLEFIQQTEIFAVKYFQLIVDNISSLDLADSEQCSLIIDFNNIFWTFIVNSSHSLREKYIYILFQKLTDNIIPEAQQAIAYLLDCLSLTEPELMLEITIQLMKKKLIKKRTDPTSIEKMKSNAMWFMLENNENKDRILEYEFALFSDVSIKYYVNILENAISYSRTYLLNHIDTVETIAYLCFFQDDLSVFEKSCDIIHTVILTLGYSYPLDVSLLNPSERQVSDQSKYQYLQKLGKTSLKKFQLDWYSPGPNERVFINKWIQQTIYKVFEFFQTNYFDKQEFPFVDYEKDYMNVIHKMLFDDNSNDLLAVSKLQKDFYKYLYVALAVFSGINVRVPFIQPAVLETDRQKQYREIYKGFEDKFMFEEFSNLRNDLTELCMKLPSLFHHTRTITDSSLVEIFQFLIRECFGESYLIEEIKRSNELIDGLCTLNDFHRPNVFSNRFTLAGDCAAFLNEKIDMFFFLNPYLGSQKMTLFNSFFILSFHPTYSFRMSIRFDHDLNFSLTNDNLYEPMHKKAFAIMNHYVRDERIFFQEMTPITEKVQEMLLMNLRIESLQKFPCCAANPDTFHYIFSCIDVFEQLDKKIWQQRVIDQIVKTLSNTYNDAYLFSHLRTQYLKVATVNPIIKSCELYNTLKQTVIIDRDSISKVQAEKVKQAFLEIIAKANDKAEDPKTHWKIIVLSGLFVIYFLNVIEDINHSEIVRFARISTEFAMNRTDIHLAQYGRAILFRLLNLRKRRVVKKVYEPMSGCFGPSAGSEIEEEGEGEFTLQEFFKYHFIKKNDLSSYLIKSREIGTYYDYSKLYNKTGYEMFESEGELAKILINRFTDPVFFQNYIESVFESKEIYASDQDEAETEAIQIDIGQGEIFEQIQVLFSFTFDSDKKKTSLFNINLSFNLFEFNARLLKKAFQALGDRFFKISSPIISALVDDYNNLPKQRVISIYVWSVLKWTQRVPKSERQQYIDYCVNLASDCITNCSLELFRDWLLSMSLATKNNSFDNIEEFFSRVLAGLKTQNGLGKRFRYHKLLKILITHNQTWARTYALEGLQMIIDSEIEDIKGCDENTSVFTEVLCSAIVSRINIRKLKEENWIKGGVQQYIDSKELIILNEYTAFENNKLITQFISQLFEKLKKEKNDSKKKILSHMTFKVLESISIRKLNDLFWGYFRPFFTYIIDNKPENVNEIEILKSMACNEYPLNIRKDVKSILAEKLLSDNWVSRQKVILFCKNFLIFEEYEENLVQVDNLILKGLTDKNNSVSLLAVECLGEILKLATKEEQNTIFQKYRVLSQSLLPKDKQSQEYKTVFENKQIAVQVLMSLLLAFREEVLPWTEDALREVINAKTINQNMKKKVKEFVGQYWRDQTETITFNSIALSDKIKKQIREIANPFDYFA